MVPRRRQVAHPRDREQALDARQVLQTYAARFGQEDTHRQIKQQLSLGTEQGRRKNVVLRGFRLRLLALILLHLLRRRLDQQQGRCG